MKVQFSAIFLPLILLCWLATPVSVVQARAYVDGNNQAVELLEQGHYLEAIELLKKSLASVPYNELIQRNLLHSYLAAGQGLMQQKRYAELAELMLEAQEFDDTQRDFWQLRGYALLQLKQYYEAEIELQEARAMGAPDVQILFMLGKIYYNTDRMYEAFDVLESAFLHDPDNHAVSRMLEKVRRELAVEKKMAKEYGGNFIITFDGEQNDDLGRDVLEVLEEAYNWVGLQLDYYSEERITVILYSRQQFSSLTNSPDWAGGLYDGKIRLSVGGISSVNSAVRALLYHEYMHVVLRDIAGKNLPSWLNEGLAEMAHAHINELDLGELVRAREQKKLFRLATLEGSFREYRGHQVSLAYQQSYSAVRFLIDEYGWHHVRDLVFALGAGASITQAIDEVLGGYGVDYQSFEERWRESG